MSSKGICEPQKGQIEQFRCRIDNELIRVPYFSRSVDCVSDTGASFLATTAFSFLPSFGRGRLAFFRIRLSPRVVFGTPTQPRLAVDKNAPYGVIVRKFVNERK